MVSLLERIDPIGVLISCTIPAERRPNEAILCASASFRWVRSNSSRSSSTVSSVCAVYWGRIAHVQGPQKIPSSTILTLDQLAEAFDEHREDGGGDFCVVGQQIVEVVSSDAEHTCVLDRFCRD